MTDMPHPTPDYVTYPDADSLARSTAERFTAKVTALQNDGAVPRVSLTGGRIAKQIYAALADVTEIDWRRIELWWSDERFLPTGDDERNETDIRAVLLDRVDLDPQRVHPMPVDNGQGVRAAAEAYAHELTDAGVDSFDLTLLGMGPDGHVASLFPGHASLDVDEPTVLAEVDSPKPPPKRTTLTLPWLNTSDEVWFLVAGEDKSDAVATVHRQTHLPELPGDALPAARVSGRSATVWLLDESAGRHMR